MAFLDPYAVDGATITGAQLRRALFASTQGATGVQGPNDLKVSGLAGGAVGIAPGSGVVAVESRRESYQVDNGAMDGDAVLSVPTAGSSGATHYVVVEVGDSEQPGQTSGTYPRLVSSLGSITRPYVPLARFTLPSGGTVGPTTPMTDLRVVANPRTVRRPIAYVHPATTITMPNDGNYVTIGSASFDVPTWATRAIVRVDASGVGALGGNIVGDFSAWIFGATPEGTMIDIDGGDRWERGHAMAGGTFAVPASARGGSSELLFKMRSRGSSDVGAILRVNAGTTLAADVEFQEVAA